MAKNKKPRKKVRYLENGTHPVYVRYKKDFEIPETTIKRCKKLR